MQKYSHTDIVDAVIIGTGAGGSPILAWLSKAGLHCVALEAGPFFNPSTDYATDEQEQEKIFWQFERLSAGKNPLAFGKNNSGIGVGGSTIHFTAYTPRPQPDDFSIYSEFGDGNNWPINYYDLENYYDELENFLGISGPSPYPWGPQRKRNYPLQPLPLNAAAQLMQRGCKPFKIKTSPAANAALSGAYYQQHVGWRKACTNRGFCQAGCSVGAKASMDVTFIPYAIHFGAEVRAESFVTSFEKNATGNITAVIYKRNGKEERQPCKNVFLCAGAIETPRLLLMNNLANSNGMVGKNFMAHVGTQVWGEFVETVRPNKGIPGGLISEDMHRPAGAGFAGGYILQSIGVMPVTYASQLARSSGFWGQALRDKMRAYNHTAGINMHGECLPSEQNFLELSEEKDQLGLPKPRIHFTIGDNENKMSEHGEKLMLQIWEAAGAQNIIVQQRMAHTIGTCRMSNDEATGVVKSNGQSFEVPNLYIADNSVFPGSLSANPALTIMAIALRTADLFLKQQKAPL